MTVPSSFSATRVPAITNSQWLTIARTLHKGTELTVAGLDAYSGIGTSAATSLILGLHEDGCANLVILVHHSCRPEHVAARRFADGFQPTPWRCTWCGNDAGENDLAYEAVAFVLADVQVTL
jgi:hypothetical protein